MWISVDDTDSRKGGCTTNVLSEIVRILLHHGYDIIGYPRLVRLNPNIPYKTRGNGALTVKFGRGTGKRFQIGAFGEENIFAYSTMREDTTIDEATRQEIITLTKSLMQDDENTQSAVVFSSRQLNTEFYRRALEELLKPEDALEYLDETEVVEFKSNARGKIGATAALGWVPKRYTFELIGYRYPERIGTVRAITEESVMELDEKTQYTFDNYDRENRYAAVCPNSPCPVLFGIRGTNPDELIRAKDTLKGEEYSKWMLYKTNQGTDDHIRDVKLDKVRPYMSIKSRATVVNMPRAIEGGHIIFTVTDGTSSIDCAAYEPTKQFKSVIKALRPGDEIVVFGGIRNEPRTLNLEKIKVISLAKNMIKVANPVCPNCGISMHSAGKNNGFKCRKCGAKLPTDAAVWDVEERSLEPGYYEVPTIARRHLAMPLKLMPVFSNI